MQIKLEITVLIMKAKSFNTFEQKRIQYLCILADYYLGLDNQTKAKECYNDGFILAMQIGYQTIHGRIKSNLAKME